MSPGLERKNPMVTVSGLTTVRHITVRMPTQKIPIRESMDVKWTGQVPKVYPDSLSFYLWRDSSQDPTWVLYFGLSATYRKEKN